MSIQIAPGTTRWGSLTALEGLVVAERSRRRFARFSLWVAVFLCACNAHLMTLGPAAHPGPPAPDPPISQVVVHVVLSQAGLSQLLEENFPVSGEETLPLYYRWERGPFDVSFDNAAGTVSLSSEVQVDTLRSILHFKLNMAVSAQPVVDSDYQAILQMPVVTVATDDIVLRLGESVAGVLTSLKRAAEERIKALRFDLRPMVASTYSQLTQPLRLQVGPAQMCLDLGVRGVDAGPWVMAGGLEKDLAMVVAPSVALSCTALGVAPRKATLPPLHNVPSLQSASFVVTIPITATYRELQRELLRAIPGGRWYPSKEFPELYLERPELYSSDGQIVLKVHLDGYVKKLWRVHVDGDLYLAGSPSVQDNKLEVPDARLTLETQSALLKHGIRLDTEAMRRQVRDKLRLDIGPWLEQLRVRLGKDLSQQIQIGKMTACVLADPERVEMTGIYAHDSHVRLYAKLHARAAAYLPCPAP